MIVCLCHRVSGREIARQACGPCGSFEQMQDELLVGRSCGACVDCAREIYESAAASADHSAHFVHFTPAPMAVGTVALPAAAPAVARMPRAA